MRVAAIQVEATENRAQNLEHAADLGRQAVDEGAEVILLPELFSVPFVSAGEVDPDYFQYAESLDGPTVQMVKRLSQQHEVAIVASVFEQATIPGVYHNTACIYVRGERVLTYRKAHLPYSSAFPEKFYFRPGSEPPTVFQWQDATLGVVICYERHFPEIVRVPALLGATLIAIPVACATPATSAVFELELRAHAVFNGLFVAAANRVGNEGGKTYYGRSMIVAPTGDVLAQAATDRPEVIVADCDFDLVAKQRHTLPFFRDRRPELYSDLHLPPTTGVAT